MDSSRTTGAGHRRPRPFVGCVPDLMEVSSPIAQVHPLPRVQITVPFTALMPSGIGRRSELLAVRRQTVQWPSPLCRMTSKSRVTLRSWRHWDPRHPSWSYNPTLDKSTLSNGTVCARCFSECRVMIPRWSRWMLHCR